MCLTPKKQRRTVGGEYTAPQEAYLEHYVLTWTIHNCSLYLCSDAFCLNSALFQLENSLTGWRIGICGKTSDFSLHLARSENDDGPEAVDVNYKLSLKNNVASKVLCQKIESFGKSSKQVESDPQFNLEHFVNGKNSENEEKLVIVCEIFILLQDSPSKRLPFDEPSEDLKELATDLLSLYENCGDCDITLRTSDGVLKAHKAVLAARSVYFADIYRGLSEKTFSKISSKVMDKLLRYMYSGSFVLLQCDLPDLFTLNGAIDKLKLSDLTEMFAAKEIHSWTEFESENFEFKWSVKDMQLHGKYGCKPIKSPYYKTSRGTWHLELCPNKPGSPDEKYLGVQISVSNLSQEISAVVEVCLDNTDMSANLVPEELKRMRVVRKLESEEKIEFPNFIEKGPNELIKQYLSPRGTLPLSVKVKSCLPQLIAKTNLEKIIIPAQTPVLPGGKLNKLSEDFFRLFKEGNNSDMELDLKGKRLKVHKAILATRWPYLANRIEQNPTNGGKVFSMDFAYFKLMEKVLMYIYSGKINLTAKDTVSIGEVCFVANAYKIPKLRNLCYAAFKSTLNVDNAHTLLLWAQTAYAEELVAVALNFIRSNSTLIFSTETWQDCREIYPEMTKEAESWASSKGGLP